MGSNYSCATSFLESQGHTPGNRISFAFCCKEILSFSLKINCSASEVLAKRQVSNITNLPFLWKHLIRTGKIGNLKGSKIVKAFPLYLRPKTQASQDPLYPVRSTLARENDLTRRKNTTAVPWTRTEPFLSFTLCPLQLWTARERDDEPKPGGKKCPLEALWVIQIKWLRCVRYLWHRTVHYKSSMNWSAFSFFHFPAFRAILCFRRNQR